MPALLTSTSIRPNSVHARSIKRLASDSRSVWVSTKIALVPAARISSATRRPRSASISAIAICAPSSPRSRAVASPIPDAPPVIAATFPLNPPIRFSFCPRGPAARVPCLPRGSPGGIPPTESRLPHARRQAATRATSFVEPNGILGHHPGPDPWTGRQAGLPREPEERPRRAALDTILQLILNGVAVGCIYGLVALGF